MIRLHVVVEGQTEQAFVSEVLAPELWPRDIIAVTRRVTTGRGGVHGRREDQVFRGGIRSYSQLKTDLVLLMKEHRKADAWFTTMIDLYALPKDFPGFADCRNTDPIERVECLEEYLARDVSHPRFLPYLQLHEFEALLFSDTSRFETRFPGDASLISKLLAIRNAFPTPEHINDRPDLAPSKRILSLRADYGKTVAGPTIAASIGLATLRRECPHFHKWICSIEALTTPPALPPRVP
jgi:Domain of unknown function (DUF4276)